MKKQAIVYLMAILNFFTKWFKKHRIYVDAGSIVVLFKNESDADKDAVLFGKNEYLESANFGSDKDIIVTVLNGCPYIQLLRQSASSPFKIRNFRMSFDVQDRPFYMHSPITYYYKEKEQEYTYNLVPLVAIDLYQFSQEMIDTTRFNKTVDENTFFRLKVKGKTSLAITLYTLNPKWVSYFELRKVQRAARKRTGRESVVIHTQFSWKLLFKKLFKFK